MEAIQARRSIRRFKANPVPYATLLRLVDGARRAPSASNLQPLEYIIVDDEELVGKIFPSVQWARHVHPHRDPPPGMEPRAYIVLMVNKNLSGFMSTHDLGAAAENIMLAAVGEGLGSCWLGAFSRPKVRELLDIPEHLEIDTLIALGAPAEQPVLDDLDDPNSETAYWLDDNDVLHVPKRALGTIVSHGKYGRQ